jgi:hypothetical protein
VRRSGLEIVRVLEAADASLQRNATPITLDPTRVHAAT